MNQFKNLKVLDLRNNELNNETMKSISKFIKWNPSLKKLNLQGKLKKINLFKNLILIFNYFHFLKEIKVLEIKKERNYYQTFLLIFV